MMSWAGLLFFILLVPFVMMVDGYWMKTNPPKEIHAAAGSRTSLSVKNEDTWMFANTRLGELWMIWGFILFVLTIAAMCFCLGKGLSVIELFAAVIILLQLIVMLIPIFVTEADLKKKFDENGSRRS
ncbi:MAG: SdpI family protein [Erysipelotrichaceae bacterium]|nr:SdpI family protein [Erysipelotrichaceae bacterium]